MTELELQPLVKIDQKSIGQVFIGYLASEGIHAQLAPDEGGFVALVEKAHIHRAADLFKEFIKQPYHPKYQQAAWHHSEASDIQHDGLLKDTSAKFFAHAGVITLSVFAICWLVFLAAVLGLGSGFYRELSFYNAFSIEAFIASPWKIIGPAFIHFSWLHIVFNTMWWWQLGGAIEKGFSKATLINLFLFSAIASNLGQFLVSGPNFGGLSGVVYAVVGFVWFSGYLMPEKGLGLSKAIIGFLTVLVVVRLCRYFTD